MERRDGEIQSQSETLEAEGLGASVFFLRRIWWWHESESEGDYEDGGMPVSREPHSIFHCG